MSAGFRSALLGLAVCATLAAFAASAGASVKLSADRAAKRSASFAERTCDRDRYCVRHAVLNCRRQARRAVLCRILDERDTRAQGRYACSRLIRVSLDPAANRASITGLGRWHC